MFRTALLLVPFALLAADEAKAQTRAGMQHPYLTRAVEFRAHACLELAAIQVDRDDGLAASRAPRVPTREPLAARTPTLEVERVDPELPEPCGVKAVEDRLACRPSAPVNPAVAALLKPTEG